MQGDLTELEKDGWSMEERLTECVEDDVIERMSDDLTDHM